MSNEEKIANILHKHIPIQILTYYLNKEIDINASRLVYFVNHLQILLNSETYRKNRERGSIVFHLDYSNSGKGETFLSEKSLESYYTERGKKGNVISMDYQGRCIDKSSEENYSRDYENHLDVLNFAEKFELLIFYIEGLKLHIFCGGKYLDYIPNIDSHNRKSLLDEKKYPIEKYPFLVNEHYTSRLYKQKAVKYFKTKKDKIFYPSPEDIFRKDLAAYLRENVTNGDVLQEPLNNEASDRNDIRVKTYIKQDVYIFEIKWLGKSETEKGKFTQHFDKSANAGAEQVNIYLRDDVNASCGVLLLYDGRKEDKEIEWYESLVWHKNQESPIRHFLETESASTKAKKIRKT